METRHDPAEALRARGLRVTSQRRAILGAFASGGDEHLSADEVHARASAVVPDIGRGTVYATLAELTELGLLAARGSPEAVRYETNTAPHQHFRCRLCLRWFDVELADPDGSALVARGFGVEQVTVTVEGVCAECRGYDAGLRAGARRARRRPSKDLPEGLAAGVVDTPLGPLTVAATSAGVVRAVFEDHADALALRALKGGPRAARAHVTAARAAVEAYLAGEPAVECPIDWDRVDGAETLRAALAVPRGRTASYDELDTPANARERGRVLGANPLALLVPCHRVMRGRELPADYVGGPERRRELLELERRQAS